MICSGTGDSDSQYEKGKDCENGYPSQLKPLSEADKKKATADWARFKKTLSKELAIVAEYAHIWGTTYNGMILVESRDLSTFHDFWHRFREATRWYVPETRTYIAQKEED